MKNLLFNLFKKHRYAVLMNGNIFYETNNYNTALRMFRLYKSLKLETVFEIIEYPWPWSGEGDVIKHGFGLIKIDANTNEVNK
jgi:hypothetical protein